MKESHNSLPIVACGDETLIVELQPVLQQHGGVATTTFLLPPNNIIMKYDNLAT